MFRALAVAEYFFFFLSKHKSISGILGLLEERKMEEREKQGRGNKGRDVGQRGSRGGRVV